jgi:protease I
MAAERDLTGKRVAILIENVYEDMELLYPYYRLKEAGASVQLVGPEVQKYSGKHGYPMSSEVAARDVGADDFDGVVIPGGYAPDKLRRYPEVLDIVKGVFDKGGLVAAICHAGWVPISAGILKGKTGTCVPAIKDDMINAGMRYVDEPVVVDGSLVTSRTPVDLPQYLPAIIEVLSGERVAV